MGIAGLDQTQHPSLVQQPVSDSGRCQVLQRKVQESSRYGIICNHKGLAMISNSYRSVYVPKHDVFYPLQNFLFALIAITLDILVIQLNIHSLPL